MVVGNPRRPQPGVLQRRRPERKGTKLVIVKVIRGSGGRITHKYYRCPRPRRPIQPWSSWRMTLMMFWKVRVGQISSTIALARSDRAGTKVPK